MRDRRVKIRQKSEIYPQARQCGYVRDGAKSSERFV